MLHCISVASCTKPTSPLGLGSSLDWCWPHSKPSELSWHGCWANKCVKVRCWPEGSKTAKEERSLIAVVMAITAVPQHDRVTGGATVDVNGTSRESCSHTWGRVIASQLFVTVAQAYVVRVLSLLGSRVTAGCVGKSRGKVCLEGLNVVMRLSEQDSS